MFTGIGKRAGEVISAAQTAGAGMESGTPVSPLPTGSLLWNAEIEVRVDDVRFGLSRP